MTSSLALYRGWNSFSYWWSLSHKRTSFMPMISAFDLLGSRSDQVTRNSTIWILSPLSSIHDHCQFYWNLWAVFVPLFRCTSLLSISFYNFIFLTSPSWQSTIGIPTICSFFSKSNSTNLIVLVSLHKYTLGCIRVSECLWILIDLSALGAIWLSSAYLSESCSAMKLDLDFLVPDDLLLSIWCSWSMNLSNSDTSATTKWWQCSFESI